MRSLILLMGAFVVVAGFAGCGPDVRQIEEKDKANLDRLAKEGIGAPGDAGKEGAAGQPGQIYAPQGPE